MRLFLLRYGEIGTKSENVRKNFEDILVQNMERMFLNEDAEVFFERERGRIFAHADEEHSDIFARTFGLVSYSPVIQCSSELDDIVENGVDFAGDIGGTFAVRSRRKGGHDYNSQELAEELGEALLNANPKAEVDLDEPDYELWVEVRDRDAYIFDEIRDAPGGLPLSSQGKVAAYISSRNDLIAAWLMMKRGARAYIYHEPSCELVDELKRWDPNLRILGQGSREDFLDEDLPDYIEGIVLGERLTDYEPMKHRPPVFRPLVALSDEWIRDVLVRIDELGGRDGWIEKD